MGSRWIVHVLLLTALLGCGAAENATSDDAARDQARAEVLEASQSYMEAVRSLDAGAVAGAWMEGSILMAPGMPSLRGPAAIEQFLSEVYPSMKVLALEITEQEIEVWGDMAVETTSYVETLQVGDDAPQSLSGRYLFVWKRQPDRSWRAWRGMFNYTSAGEEDPHQVGSASS